MRRSTWFALLVGASFAVACSEDAEPLDEILGTGGTGGSAGTGGTGGTAGAAGAGGMGGAGGTAGAGGTGERQWGDTVLIETDDAGDAFAPQVALDPNGNAVAVWTQNTTSSNIWANRFTPSGGWGAAERIETAGGNFPQVALDANGNAVAVWNRFDGTRADIWANRFTPSGGWGAAELIETDDAGNAFAPQVALDAIGNAVAVWSQFDGTSADIWANRFTPSGGWGAAERIETDNAGGAMTPQVALDANGNAVAVWSQSDGTRDNIWANRFTPSGGWGAAELLETDNVDYAINPQVALDPNGNAVAVWQQSDGTRDNIWANRFTPSGGWGAAELIETDNAGAAGNPQVTLDPNGSAVAVWSQFDGTRNTIRANRYTVANSWGTPEMIEDNTGRNSFLPQVALDSNGNAVAVWAKVRLLFFDDDIWANRFTPIGGWGAAELIETNEGNAFAPELALDPDGNAIAVWSQSDGTRNNIWANRADFE